MKAEEFTGSDIHRNIQRRMLARHAEIAADPALGNGGRVLNVLDPDAFGWDRLFTEVVQDRFVALTAMDRATIFERIKAAFGSQAEIPSWDVFFGDAPAIQDRCTALASGLPDGWVAISYANPDTQIIGEVQKLNTATGVAPMPAWYMRGDLVPQITTCIFTTSGALAACAMVSNRYHADGPLAGTVFLGSISVASEHRGRGLGVAVTSRALLDSAAAYGWQMVMSQVASDNPASRAMIERCGMLCDPSRVTVVINLSGAAVTR